MKKLLLAFILPFSLIGQKIKLDVENLTASHVTLTFEKKMVKVEIDTTIKGADQPTYAKLNGINFKNGIIEVKVLSQLMKNAPPTSRGFIGVSFRVNPNDTKFENFYIRPSNGRAEDQVRRNHSTQYFSYPDYDFARFRKEAPEKYESYADMGLGEWISLRIEVNGAKAKLYINNAKQPALIVNDLKHGENLSGSIGLWVGNYTEGYFKDLKIFKQE
jgi:ribosomal protein S8E